MLRTHQTFKEGRKRVTIQYMPAGESVIDATVNGQPARRTVRVDGKTAARLQEDLEAAHARSAAGQAAAPCGYFDHRSGPASFRPVRFIDGGSRGVLLEVELTEAGRKALEGGDYGYFSPNFRRDKATGEVLGLRADTVEVGSLVNDPAFQTIEQIAAARANAEEEDAEGEENVSTARPLAFSKEKQSKKFPPAEFYEDDEEGDEEEETEKPAPKGKAPATHIPPAVAKDIEETTDENDRAFLKEWKNRKKKPARKEETAAASRTFLQAWGQHQAEQVEAANPYGCNQYGHGFKREHEGHSAQKTFAFSSSPSVVHPKAKELTKGAKEAKRAREKYREENRKLNEQDGEDADYDNIGHGDLYDAEEKAWKEAAKHPDDETRHKEAMDATKARKEATEKRKNGAKEAAKAQREEAKRSRELDRKFKAAEKEHNKQKRETAKKELPAARKKLEEIRKANWDKHVEHRKRTGKNTWDRTKEGRAAHEEWRKQNAIVEELERDLRRK